MRMWDHHTLKMQFVEKDILSDILWTSLNLSLFLHSFHLLYLIFIMYRVVWTFSCSFLVTWNSSLYYLINFLTKSKRILKFDELVSIFKLFLVGIKVSLFWGTLVFNVSVWDITSERIYRSVFTKDTAIASHSITIHIALQLQLWPSF